MSQTLNEKEITQASRGLMPEVSALQGKPLTYMELRQIYARVRGSKNDQHMTSALQNPPPTQTVSLSNQTIPLLHDLMGLATANRDKAMISFETPSYRPGTNLLSAASNDRPYRWIWNEVRNTAHGLLVMLNLEIRMAQAAGWPEIHDIRTTTIDALLHENDHDPAGHTLLLTLNSDFRTG